MIKWFKRNQQSSDSLSVPEVQEETALIEESTGFFTRFKKSLTKTRHQLGEGVARIFLGKKTIDADLLEELETVLISADLGMETTTKLLASISAVLARDALTDGDAVMQGLRAQMHTLLLQSEKPLIIPEHQEGPFVILMVGVNGAGKTTTIGKLAKNFQEQGKKVMLAAGDTFRAAAVEQLKVWGERNAIPVIAQHTGADSASVIFDALQAAKARGIDVLIADTAGRLHTQDNLMEELKKIKRVLHKIDPLAPHETMLVLDVKSSPSISRSGTINRYNHDKIRW
jgi:fused signal recognition particle receptor